MPNFPIFDVNHLKKVITEVDEAAKRSSLTPQLKKDKFSRKVVDTSVFQELKPKFFKTTTEMGEKIFMLCHDAYTKKDLTESQCNELAKMGNTLVNTLPFEMLSGKMDLKKGFRTFVGTLRTLGDFSKDHPDIPNTVSSKILSALKPLDHFVNEAQKTIETSTADPSIKEGLQQRLTRIKDESTTIKNKAKKLVRASITQAGPAITKAPPKPKTVLENVEKDLLSTIFPIGEKILNTGLSLFTSGILNDEQRNELAGIGTEIMSLPFKLLTGEIDFTGLLMGLIEGLLKLVTFFVSNPEIALKAGASILSGMLPLGGFLQTASKLISDVVLTGGGAGDLLKKGLELLPQLSEQVLKLEDTLETSAKQALQAGKT